LGAKVSVVKDIPDGMSSRQVGAGEYAVFTDKGKPAAEMVIGIWKEIWSLETDKKLERAYRTDFEVYSPDTSVQVYVGLLARG
jgi:predicted transcriptional regulator YdeE